MKKKIIFLVVSLIVVVLSTVLLIPMINYVATFSNMNSFMRLGDAIGCVVVLSLLVCGGATFTVIFLVQIILKREHKKSK
jgi:hypothetical protein